MKIGIDIDGVITDSFTVAVHQDFLLNGKTQEEDLTAFWLNYDRDLSTKMLDSNIMSTPIYYSIKPPKHGVVETLNKLTAMGHKLYYVTSRPEAVKVDTEMYFRRYNIPQRNTLIFAENKQIIVDSIGIQLFLDDNPKFIEQLKNSCKAVLMDTPYNKDYQAEDRIYSFEELLNYVK